jgi:hypothetical protein
MIAISKSMVVLSALTAAGLVVAFESMPRAHEASPAAQVQQRFPLASEVFSPVSMIEFVGPKLAAQAAKADRLPISETCAREDWPHPSQRCLIANDSNSALKVSRLITIERRIGENTSELVRMPVADLAQR